MTDIVNQGYLWPPNSPQLNGGVVSAASFVADVARGGLASIFGTNMGNDANTTVYINGFPAPVFYASSGQFNVQIPGKLPGWVLQHDRERRAQQRRVQRRVHLFPDVFTIRRLRPRLLTPTAPWYRTLVPQP